MRRSRQLLFAALGLVLAQPAAAVPTDSFTLAMELRFLGMTVGDVAFTGAVGADRADARMDVDTSGLVRALTGFRSEVRSAARLDGTGDAWPSSFVSVYETKRDRRNVTLRFDGDGRVVELATLKRGQPDAVEVPADLQQRTMDPLSAIFTIRNWLAGVRDDGAGARTLELFDGRRRYDLDVRYVARRAADFDGGRPILELRLDVRPIAGFNRTDDRGGGRQLVVLVSDDDLLVPLVMRTTMRDGIDAVVRTTRICRGPEAAPTSCADVAF